MLFAALIFCLVLRLQQPAFVARQELDFFWPSMQAFLGGMLCLLPLLWTLNRGAGAGDWIRRNARAPFRSCISCWLGICMQGLLLILGNLAITITVKSIYGDQDLQPGGLALLWRSLALLGVTAALAPALAFSRLGNVASSLLWFLLLASSLGVFGLGVPMPLDRILSEADSNLAWDWAIPGLTATIAGLLVSWAMISRRSS
jgi:hypothetical protein